MTPLGRNDTQTAVVVFNDWALALDKLGQPLEAERLFRRAIDISRAGQTEETVSPILLNNYAKTLYQLGRLEEAADYAGRAYAKAQQTGDQMVIYQSLYVACVDLTLSSMISTVRQPCSPKVEPVMRRKPPARQFLVRVAGVCAGTACVRER